MEAGSGTAARRIPRCAADVPGGGRGADLPGAARDGNRFRADASSRRHCRTGGPGRPVVERPGGSGPRYRELPPIERVGHDDLMVGLRLMDERSRRPVLPHLDRPDVERGAATFDDIEPGREPVARISDSDAIDDGIKFCFYCDDSPDGVSVTPARRTRRRPASPGKEMCGVRGRSGSWVRRR